MMTHSQSQLGTDKITKPSLWAKHQKKKKSKQKKLEEEKQQYQNQRDESLEKEILIHMKILAIQRTSDKCSGLDCNCGAGELQEEFQVQIKHLGVPSRYKEKFLSDIVQFSSNANNRDIGSKSIIAINQECHFKIQQKYFSEVSSQATDGGSITPIIMQVKSKFGGTTGIQFTSLASLPSTSLWVPIGNTGHLLVKCRATIRPATELENFNFKEYAIIQKRTLGGNINPLRSMLSKNNYDDGINVNDIYVLKNIALKANSDKHTDKHTLEQHETTNRGKTGKPFLCKFATLGRKRNKFKDGKETHIKTGEENSKKNKSSTKSQISIF